MRHKLLAEDGGERVFILVLDAGEEAFSSIRTFANEQGIAAASVTAIGAFQSATIAFFEVETKEYRNIHVDEQSEALSLMGDVAIADEGSASLHLHAVLGLSDGSTRGGHFVEGQVRPTLEVVIRETPARLRRKHRRDLGLALIDLD